MRKLSQHWVTIFEVPNKFSVDNNIEFGYREFITFFENLNIKICTTATESPLSNGLAERHTMIFGITVSDIMKDILKNLLEITVARSIKDCCFEPGTIKGQDG